MVSIGSRIWMFGVAGPEACLGYEASRVYLCYVARSPTRKEERRRKNWNDLDVTVFCLPLVPWIERIQAPSLVSHVSSLFRWSMQLVNCRKKRHDASYRCAEIHDDWSIRFELENARCRRFEVESKWACTRPFSIQIVLLESLNSMNR